MSTHKKSRKKVFSVILLYLIVFFACNLSVHAEENTASDKLKIGVIVYLTGPTSFIGVQIQQAMLLCNDPTKNELIFEDSQYNPAVAVTALNKLIDTDRAQMIVASGSGVISAIAPIVKQKGIPTLATAVSSDKVFASGGDVIVRYFPSAKEEAAIMADFMRNNIRTKRAGVFYVADDYGQSFGEAFAQRFIAQGGEITLNDNFTKGESDFRLYLMRASKSKPDLLYIVALNDNLQTIIKQANELHVPYSIAGNSVMSSPDVVKGRELLMEGIHFTNPTVLGSQAPEITEFRQKFRAKYQTEPSFWAAIGCDLSRLLLKYGNSDPQLFRKAVDNISDYVGVMGKVTPKGNGDLSFPMCVSRVKEGKIDYCF